MELNVVLDMLLGLWEDNSYGKRWNCRSGVTHQEEEGERR